MGSYVWENALGQKRYQPLADNGERQWVKLSMFAEKKSTWAVNQSYFAPKLYRSKKRAERVAARRSFKINMSKMSEMKPIGLSDEK